MSIDASSEVPSPNSEVPVASKEKLPVEAYVNWVSKSSRSPLVDALRRVPGQEVNLEDAPVMSEEDIRVFKGKLVDLNIIPERTTETRISDEDLARLRTMDPSQQKEAINKGLRNIVLRATGNPTGREWAGGVEFKTYEVNNRTGESKPVNPNPPPKL